MAKMTPEQEAAYAHGFGVSRDGLTPAAQEVYDRLLEQRRRGEPDVPLSLADAEAASRAVIHDARGALAEGRRVFLCRIPAMYDQPIAVGTAGPARAELGYRVNREPRLAARPDVVGAAPGTGQRATSFSAAMTGRQASPASSPATSGAARPR